MKYTLPALTLAISAALSGCATPHSSAVSQPVVDSPVPNVAQPLQRQLAEGLYEMALSPQGDALYVASAEGFKNVQGGAVYTLDPHTLNTIGLTHTDLKNSLYSSLRRVKRCMSAIRWTAASALSTPPPAR